jgi:DNA mismatch repair protein MutS
MRQVALISILAQIGSFVPAAKAEIPLVDRIFTRIGAADDLIGGQSTFMVEMADIQIMTEKATPRSLIIIDELGRGTSTSEGMAIAQAVIEYVHDRIGCKALVSTHFHELAYLEHSLRGLNNYSMAVQESGDKVHFLRKLIPGAADTSYGIYCARLAGLPDEIIGRAYGLLKELEEKSPLADGSSIAVAGAPAKATASADAAATAGSSSQAVSPLVKEQTAPIVRETAATDEAVMGSSGAALAEAAATAAAGATEAAASAELKSDAGEVGPVVQLSMFGDDEPPVQAKPAAPAPEDPATRTIINLIKNADLMNMTPLQAMQLVNDLKMKAKDL